MKKLFGTDGIRGVANKDLNSELALKTGKALAKVLKAHKGGKPKILIGKDSRQSGDMLESAFAAGLCSFGADVTLLGLVPTPAVACLVKLYQADAGVVISASHNSAMDNGIKIFGGDGFKIPDMYEDEITAFVLSPDLIEPDVDGTEVGRISFSSASAEDYAGFVVKTCDINLSGTKVLIDCANGGASPTAGKIFGALGADFTLIGCEPDGRNINLNCGALHTDSLAGKVIAGGYDLGLAFDGDADRLMAVDSHGNLVDGDIIIAIFARYWNERGRLAKNTVVGTIMTNIGLIRYFASIGIRTLTTKVGDKFVLEEIEKNGYNLGGEQSGHIIIRDLHTTGDGQLSAVQLLKILKESGKTIEELAAPVRKFPQVTINVTMTKAQRNAICEDEDVLKEIAKWSGILAYSGRILVRPSGTELLVRVMVEGQDSELIRQCAESIAAKIRERIAYIA
ncbi:MAG: phosphoglucosamine mutase [Oscillospiraceae bacterium]|nr:phosphoglucosamine mutase [Oscillospiraceae bacterium]